MRSAKESCKADAEWCVLTPHSEHSSARRHVCDVHLPKALRDLLTVSKTGYCSVVPVVKGIPCEGHIS